MLPDFPAIVANHPAGVAFHESIGSHFPGNFSTFAARKPDRCAALYFATDQPIIVVFLLSWRAGNPLPAASRLPPDRSSWCLSLSLTRGRSLCRALARQCILVLARLLNYVHFPGAPLLLSPRRR